MKLAKLLSCDIYRDGGSFEGLWLTDENNVWAVTLLITHWDIPTETKHFTLFNCKRDDVTKHLKIEKDSTEHKSIMMLIKEWISTAETSAGNSGVHDLLAEMGGINL